MRASVRLAMMGAVAVVGVAHAGGTAPARSTFYDYYLEHHRATEPSAIFAAERAALRALDGAEIDTFDWTALDKGPAWYNEVQSLRFLLPWLEPLSNEATARRWLLSWYTRHGLAEAGRPAWGSDLAAAQRALVLGFWLAQLQRRSNAADEGIREVLRDALRMHREHLRSERHFDGTMNVGVLQALALRETARAVASPEADRLATTRLRSTLDTILSPQGTSLEHSPQYHFIVLGWLEAAAAWYEADGDAAAPAVRAHATGMRRAGYFLLDQTDRVAQIGDADSTHVPGFSRRAIGEAGPPATTFVDSLAGYAVFKSAPPSEGGRYLVYRIQRHPIRHPEHCHADAMSLVAAWDGETVLGDSGRYLYGARGFYFASLPAHNTIFPEHRLRAASQRAPTSVETAVWRRAPDGIAVAARMEWDGVEVARGIRVPSATQAVVVEDTVQSSAEIAGASRFCWTWNAGPDVRRVILDATEPGSVSWTVETHRSRQFRFRMAVSGAPGNVEAELLRGATDPELGWYSPLYGVKRPAWVVLVRMVPGPRTIVRTVISPSD